MLKEYCWMMDTEVSYLEKAVFEIDFGIWGKFQQLEFGKRGVRQGTQNKSMGIGKNKVYLGLF